MKRSAWTKDGLNVRDQGAAGADRLEDKIAMLSKMNAGFRFYFTPKTFSYR
jgi:hypothetical protein